MSSLGSLQLMSCLACGTIFCGCLLIEIWLLMGCADPARSKSVPVMPYLALTAAASACLILSFAIPGDILDWQSQYTGGIYGVMSLCLGGYRLYTRSRSSRGA